jgi:hypothetical protein
LKAAFNSAIATSDIGTIAPSGRELIMASAVIAQ